MEKDSLPFQEEETPEKIESTISKLENFLKVYSIIALALFSKIFNVYFFAISSFGFLLLFGTYLYLLNKNQKGKKKSVSEKFLSAYAFFIVLLGLMCFGISLYCIYLKFNK